MIFNALFRPKHQHQDPAVRRQAIESLNPEDQKHKVVLHELAFNDEDAGVSLTALEKLNSFALWCKMAQTAKNERVRKKAQQQVEDAVLSAQSDVLSAGERHDFIRQCQQTSLLEKLVKLPWMQQQQTDVVLSVLKRLDKPQLSRQILLSADHLPLQQQLLADVTDVQELAKIAKKAGAEALREQAAAKLAEYEAQQQQLQETEKQTRLVLSQLLALRDNRDYQQASERFAAYQASYSAMQPHFSLLDGNIAAEFETKYQELCQRVQTSLDALAPAWQAQQQAQAAAQAFELTLSSAASLNAEIDQQLTEQLTGLTLGQLEDYQHAISQQLDALQTQSGGYEHQTPAQRKQLENVHQQLLAQQNSLDALPALQQALDKAAQLLTRLGEANVPDTASQLTDAKTFLSEVKQQWRDVSEKYRQHWPAGLQQQWQALLQPWHQAVKGLEQEQRQLVERCRSKLRALSSQIDKGRFRNALSLYQKVNDWYLQLPESAQRQVQRQFEQAKEQVENLKEWQAYLAAPRKPALLEEAKALAAEPLAIEAQIEKVKVLRSTWHSLGQLGTDEDNALNTEFDQVLEIAFQPCREFYAQQQQQREDNLAAKRALLAELEAAQGQQDSKQLAQDLSRIQQQWRQLGDIDFRLLDEINGQFRALLKPLKHQVKSFQQQNAEQKQALIDTLNQLLQSEDLYQATQDAKGLQEQWKQIDFAGKGIDAELWKQFRQLNDELFALSKQASQARRDANNQEVDELYSAVSQLVDGAKAAATDEQWQDIFSQEAQLRERILALPGRLQGRLFKGLDQVQQLKQQQQRQRISEASQKRYAALWQALESWQADNLPAELSVLPGQWQQCFSAVDNSADDRLALTLKLEILAEQPVKAEEESLRRELQMQMMASKLQQGEAADAEQLLQQWIRRGPLSEQDKPLLERIKAVYA